MIAALILDFDGLILDTETPFRTSWAEIYADFGLVVSPGQWAGLLGSSSDPAGVYELLERHLGRPVDREPLRILRIEREIELLETADAMPGVRELLHIARQRGLLLAVASSSERNWVRQHLSHLDLINVFDTVICSDDVRATKPAPDLYLAALASLNVRADQVIAFEDSVHGAQAAKRAGIFCVVVPNQVTCHLANQHADLVVPTIADRSLDEYMALATARG